MIESMKLEFDKSVFMTKWLPITIASALMISMVIWLPLLFIGLILGWILCKNRDKFKDIEKEIDSFLEDDEDNL